MKEMVRYGCTLALICALASGVLAGVNFLTKPKIIEQAENEEEASLKEVMPQGKAFEPVKVGEEIIYFKVFDAEKNFLGVAFKTSAKGYSSIIETMVGMTKDGKINNIKILSQNETPGVGAQITESKFLGQFKDKAAQNLLDVDTITGATISSKAVLDSVKKKSEEVLAQLKNER